MRTPAEIIRRIAEVEASGRDWMGIERGDLTRALPFDDAKPFLRDGVTVEDWEGFNPDTETIVGMIREYMPFAWGKANGCRGISSNRSVSHMKAWLWLLEDDLGEKLDAIYIFFGKPCLRVICEKYGWDWRQWDDGEWRNEERGAWTLPPDRINIPE